MLAFVGGKMLIADRYRISDAVSLLVVGGLIGGAALLSLRPPGPPGAAFRAGAAVIACGG